MNAITSALGGISSAIHELKTIELGIPYLYVVIYALLLLLAMMFSSKKALVLVGSAIAFYLGILQGYPYIAASLERQPLLWILYLTAGLIYLVGLGISMFLDR